MKYLTPCFNRKNPLAGRSGGNDFEKDCTSKWRFSSKGASPRSIIVLTPFFTSTQASLRSPPPRYCR